MTDHRAGRPRASSRETLAEAACELFLERGFPATTIADIAGRAGVSRSSFFNYFSSKSDVLWAGLDERITRLERSLADRGGADAETEVRAAVLHLAEDFAPDSLALALINAAAMQLSDELPREAAQRQSRVAAAVSDRLVRGGTERLRADVRGAAWGGAVFAAVQAWAREGAGRTALAAALVEAADAVTGASGGGAVSQLRVVVRAEEFDRALAFYRDVVGMPQSEAYEEAGGARVAILDAGRATLELSNPAQVAFIDEVETDGGRSDPIRIALEVHDTAAAAERLVAGGATLEAHARRTPWRSVNARLRGPADLQLTLFQELDPR